MGNTFDNKFNKLKDDLVKEIKKGSKISIASASFSMYAYKELKKQLENIDSFKFIFTSPTFSSDGDLKEKREFYIPKLNREKNIYGTEFEVRLRNELTQKAIAKECAEWIKKKACFKTDKSGNDTPKFICVEGGESSICSYNPVNNFTTTELGCNRGNNNFTFICKCDAQQTKLLLENFNELWNDANKLENVTDKILDNISCVYNENTPEFIYFFTIYHVFNEFLQDLNEDVLPNTRTGFKESAIWNKLYDFQKDACLAIINKLEKFNGCILADSVGLGKTFTALSVIKYYESRNKSVLVLCPKKLAENWITYRENYKNNPIASDRLNYKVLYHTDLGRTRGKSGDTDLSRINWGNYDLVVIDESHNFRNGGQTYKDDSGNLKDNRYNFLMNKIIREGVKTKVLMLSATPVNNHFIDLKNQLALAYEGNSEEINSKLGIGKNIDNIFRDAQRAFNRWNKLPANERTTKNLLSKLKFDFFDLLDNVTIARSRKHIEKYYNINNIGKFPDRLRPINFDPQLSDLQNTIQYKDIYKQLLDLKLTVYTPSIYIFESKKIDYELKYGDKMKSGVLFKQEDRERGIKQLMSIGLMKRMESSIFSFNETVKHIVNKIDSVLNEIDKYKQLLKKHNITHYDDFGGDFNEIDDVEEDILEEENFDNNVGGKITIYLRDMDYLTWEIDLQHDKYILQNLLNATNIITPEHDSKLQELKEVIKEKIYHPINENNKKILIFTAFADTAEYLYSNISQYVKEMFGLNTALITGSTGKSTINRLPTDINTILTCFSPISKEKQLIYPNITENIDILIATDCVSEGQNLQDCDYLVNYDIHWNPVRIIQRFGRIDRIGSKNEKIQLVNFWPNIALDEYIQLKRRVENRAKIVDISSGGGDDIIDPEDEVELVYRQKQLEKLHNEVVDIEDMDTGVSIMDLGLNEFHLDLIEYMKTNPNIDKNPMGMNAVISSSDDMPAGVIYILKNVNSSTNINNTNRLHPFYMIYIKDDGEIVFNHLQPKELLDKLRLKCKGNNIVDKLATELFNTETDDGKDMKHYNTLLCDSIDSIISIKDESDVDSLFNAGGTTALENNITGLDDFELICFLIIKDTKNV